MTTTSLRRRRKSGSIGAGSSPPVERGGSCRCPGEHGLPGAAGSFGAVSRNMPENLVDGMGKALHFHTGARRQRRCWSARVKDARFVVTTHC